MMQFCPTLQENVLHGEGSDTTLASVIIMIIPHLVIIKAQLNILCNYSHYNYTHCNYSHCNYSHYNFIIVQYIVERKHYSLLKIKWSMTMLCSHDVTRTTRDVNMPAQYVIWRHCDNPLHDDKNKHNTSSVCYVLPFSSLYNLLDNNYHIQRVQYIESTDPQSSTRSWNWCVHCAVYRSREHGAAILYTDLEVWNCHALPRHSCAASSHACSLPGRRFWKVDIMYLSRWGRRLRAEARGL